MKYTYYTALLLLASSLGMQLLAQSEPTKQQAIIIPQIERIHKDQLQTANKPTKATVAAFQATLIELIDTLYTHLHYWQQQHVKQETEKHRTHAANARDAIETEIDYHAAQLTVVTKWLDADEATRTATPIAIPTDLKAYKKELLTRLKPYQIPSHLARHWLKYTIGTACTLGALAYCHQNQVTIAALAAQTKESAKDFLRDYAYKPLKNSYDVIFGKHQEKPFISPESIQQDEQILETMIREFYKDNYASNKTPEQIEAIAQNAVQKRELPQEIADRYAQETKSPVKNLTSPWGQLGRLGIILGHVKTLRLIDIIQEVDDLRQANRLNLELSVGIPTALAGYGAYRAIKGVYRFVHPAEKNYAPITKNLLAIERVLNAFNNSTSTINDAAEGKILYRVHKLSQLESLVSTEQRTTFFTDLAELYSPDRLVEQKLHTIDRMYRTYSFLNFRAA